MAQSEYGVPLAPGDVTPVIVRVAGEGQYQLPDGVADELNRLDNQAVEAVEAGDEEAFSTIWHGMLDVVQHGQRIDDDELRESDVILPPRGISFAEAKGEFSDEGLVPKSSAEVSAAAPGSASPTSEAATSLSAEPGVRRSSRRITSDRWTVEDRLGYEPYAEAIAGFILHRDTRPPLSIGIKGPWGAGKTSLMRMVRSHIDPEAGETRLSAGNTSEASHATVADVLDVATGLSSAGGDSSSLAYETPDTRATVWFNAWMYQSSDQLWAGLADAIISQLTSRMETRERERFWIELNIKRVDVDAVRRRVHASVLSRLVPLALFVAATLVAAIGAYLLAPALGIAEKQVREVAGGSFLVTGIFCGIAAAARRSKVLQAPAAPTFTELVRAPDYPATVGYLHSVDEDMRRVLDVVHATPEHPVVVFVDDLDRCSHDAVARVVEALNLFVAGGFPNCIFVLAMEPTLVAAQIEVAYRDLGAAIDEGSFVGRPTRGWRFLDKLIQLPIALPRPEETQLNMFVLSTLTEADTSEDIDDEEVAALREEFDKRAAGPQDLAALARQWQRRASSAAVIRAAEREFDSRFSDHDPRVRALLQRHASAVSSNPREIKRFINVFRFYAFVQNRRQVRQLPAPDYDQVAKIAVLAVRWPQLVGVLGEQGNGRTLLAELEDLAGHPPPAEVPDPYEERLAALRTSQAIVEQLRSRDLRDLLAQPPTLGVAASGFL
jgi:hypothetical protein